MVGRPDAVVQMSDIRHHGRGHSQDERAHLENFLSTCWSGDATGGGAEAEEVISALGGPCFSSTGHVGMINAIIDQQSVLLHTDTDFLLAGYDDESHPGRGAFTSHHNISLLAVDGILPGMELFLDFGQEYTNYDDLTEPNMDDYRKMDLAMDNMVNFFEKHADELGPEAAADVYRFMKKEVLDLTAETRAHAARSLLPETYDALRDIIEKGGSALHAHPEVKKDVDWLEENAYCQDNLVVGVSQIPHAGRGAFLARDLHNGDVVAPLPLVALSSGRQLLKIVSTNEGDFTQLVYNYMLEHPNSSTLFYPAGPVTNFINHGGQNANVKLAWSTKSWSDTAANRERSVDELSGAEAIDIFLEAVATRDIKMGEEILLDYGDDWAESWETHVKTWKEAIKNWTSPGKTAMVLNDMHHGTGKPPQPFPTPAEEATEGLENVDLTCFIVYDDEKIERRRNADGSRTRVYPWIAAPEKADRLKNDVAFRGVNQHDCSVLERSGDETTGYKYLIRPMEEAGTSEMLIKNVPHEAIRFANKAYKNPQFEEWAFRHSIAFPDDIFPEAWKDLPDGYVPVETKEQEETGSSQFVKGTQNSVD